MVPLSAKCSHPCLMLHASTASSANILKILKILDPTGVETLAHSHSQGSRQGMYHVPYHVSYSIPKISVITQSDGPSPG